MIITVECRGCRQSIHGELELGGSANKLIADFGWIYSPVSTGFLCRKCQGFEVQSIIGKLQAFSGVSSMGGR